MVRSILGTVAQLFQYNSCYCLSGAQEQYSVVDVSFQYNSCYCLSNGFMPFFIFYYISKPRYIQCFPAFFPTSCHFYSFLIKILCNPNKISTQDHFQNLAGWENSFHLETHALSYFRKNISSIMISSLQQLLPIKVRCLSCGGQWNSKDHLNFRSQHS